MPRVAAEGGEGYGVLQTRLARENIQFIGENRWS
jgi:hypothetical protein